MVARPPDLDDLVLIPLTPEACGFGCIAHKYLLQHQDVSIGGSASFDHGSRRRFSHWKFQASC